MDVILLQPASSAQFVMIFVFFCSAKKPTELTVIIIVVVLAPVLIVIVIVYKGKSPRPTKKLSGLWVLSIIFPGFPGTKRKRTI